MTHVSMKAMAEGKVHGIRKATYFKVDPRILEFEPGFNVREECPELAVHLEEMYLSMKAGSSFPPIDVRIEDGRRILVDGHCRTRTALRLIAEGHDITLEAREFRGNEAERVAHMLTSAKGKALTPLEAGKAYFRLRRYGLDVRGIAARTGLSRTTIENGLMLAEAPVGVQKMVAQGEVSGHTAIGAMREHGSKAVAVLNDKLTEAKSNGKAKVTKGQLKTKPTGPRISAEIAKAMASSAERISEALSVEKTLALMAGELDDQKVSIPAVHLKELLTAWGGI